LVQTFSPDCPDQSLNKWMRLRNVRNRFGFRDTENPQVCFPLMKPIQRIMIRTEILRKGRYTSNRLLEHPTKRQTIDDSGLNSKSDDPPRVLVHDYQDPIRPHAHGFASHEIDAPQTVLHVAQERKPRRTTTI